MAAAISMLEVEAQLEAAAVAGTSTQPVDSSSEAGLQSAPVSSNGVVTEGFYSSGKGSTWKALKKMVKHKKEGSSEVRSSTVSTTSQPAAPGGASILIYAAQTPHHVLPELFYSTGKLTACQPTAAVSAAHIDNKAVQQQPMQTHKGLLYTAHTSHTTMVALVLMRRPGPHTKQQTATHITQPPGPLCP